MSERGVKHPDAPAAVGRGALWLVALCLPLLACNAFGSKITVDDRTLRPKYHIAAGFTQADPRMDDKFATLEELTIVSSSCPLDCDFFDENRHGFVSRHTCKGDSASVSFMRISGDGIKPGSFGSAFSSASTGSPYVNVMTYEGGTNYGPGCKMEGVELLSIGEDEVSYRADFKPMAGETPSKPVTSQLLGTFKTSGVVKAKLCRGLRRFKI